MTLAIKVAPQFVEFLHLSATGSSTVTNQAITNIPILTFAFSMGKLCSWISALGVSQRFPASLPEYYVPAAEDAQTKLPKHFCGGAGEF